MRIKSKKSAPIQKCVVHKNRAVVGQCASCGKGICHECDFINEGICGYCNELARGGLLRRKQKLTEEEKPPQKAAVPPVSRGKWKIISAPVLFGAAVLLLMLTFTGHSPWGIKIDPPKEDEIARTVKSSVLYAVNAIEAFRQDNGKLPRDLFEIGLGGDEGWEYVTYPEGGYKVTFNFKGQFFTYQSFEDPGVVFDDLISPKKEREESHDSEIQ